MGHDFGTCWTCCWVTSWGISGYLFESRFAKLLATHLGELLGHFSGIGWGVFLYHVLGFLWVYIVGNCERAFLGANILGTFPVARTLIGINIKDAAWRTFRRPFICSRNACGTGGNSDAIFRAR